MGYTLQLKLYTNAGITFLYIVFFGWWCDKCEIRRLFNSSPSGIRHWPFQGGTSIFSLSLYYIRMYIVCIMTMGLRKNNLFNVSLVTLLRNKYRKPWSDAAHNAQRLIRTFDICCSWASKENSFVPPCVVLIKKWSKMTLFVPLLGTFSLMTSHNYDSWREAESLLKRRDNHVKYCPASFAFTLY